MAQTSTFVKQSKKDKKYFFNLLIIVIQGVSEFHRQTFRVDSMIKNKHKTLNT
jgi:hypothetical protein